MILQKSKLEFLGVSQSYRLLTAAMAYEISYRKSLINLSSV